MAPGAESPLRAALAAALIAAVTVGSATGLARYLAAHSYGESARVDLADLATDVAKTVGSRGAKAAAEMAPSTSLTVVRAGTTDGFGIARGASVVLDRTAPGHPVPDGAAQAWLDRTAGLRGLVTQRGWDRLGSDERTWMEDTDDGRWLGAVAPFRGDDGSYAGMVGLRAPLGVPVDPVPWWRFLAGLLLCAGGVGMVFSRRGDFARLGACLVCGVAGAAVVASAGVGFTLWTALAAGLGAFWCIGPVAGVLRGLREQPGTYVYVLPAAIATLLLVFVPFVMGIVLAFFDAAGAPVGFANFVEILSPRETGDTQFYWTLGVTLVWTVTNVAAHVGIGLSLALVLNRPDLRFKGLYRVLLIVPWAVPSYITALTWKWMFNTQYGAVNAMLAIFGIEQIDWLGQSVLTNFMANLVTNTWLGFPFMMVVCLGALQSIPKELYEASTIDGAGRWQTFRHVTLPLLRPALVPAVILGSIWTFNMFNVIYLVSGGGPDHQTNILITEAYDAFKVLKRYGFAAAYSLLIFVVLYLYGSMTSRITRASEGAFE